MQFMVHLLSAEYNFLRDNQNLPF